MRLPHWPLAFCSVALAACGKSGQEQRADVETCSITRSTAAAITQCLAENGWSPATAESAGRTREHELDSIGTALRLIAERADSEHRSEVRDCDRIFVDLKTCLVTRYGWEESRATAADDSVWSSRADAHQRQIRSCLGRRGSGTGTCLQLHYKWLPRRALALDDSIRRANRN